MFLKDSAGPPKASRSRRNPNHHARAALFDTLDEAVARAGKTISLVPELFVSHVVMRCRGASPGLSCAVAASRRVLRCRLTFCERPAQACALAGTAQADIDSDEIPSPAVWGERRIGCRFHHIFRPACRGAMPACLYIRGPGAKEVLAAMGRRGSVLCSDSGEGVLGGHWCRC